MVEEHAYKWKFHRIGGLDQLPLRSGEEIRNLGKLDPKLWVALSCPASGLELDARTLQLVDTDEDGRIRIPEVIEAVNWTCARLKDPGSLIDPPEAMPLADLDEESEEGAHMLATARAVLKDHGKEDAAAIDQAEIAAVAVKASGRLFNGDGIIPLHESLSDAMRGYVSDVLAVMGGVRDSSGDPGASREISEAFVKSLTDWQTWRDSVQQASSPLGADTSEAWQLLQTLGVKIEDYFLRCELAAFSRQSGLELGEALSREIARSLEPYASSAPSGEGGAAAPAPFVREGLLERRALSDLPLSHVAANQPLLLASGVNPAWRDSAERLGQLLEPLLETPGVMTRKDWEKVRNGFSGYEKAVASKPALPALAVTVPPVSSVDALGEARIAEILAGDLPSRFAELADKDASSPADSASIRELERLVHYHRHLHRLLVNFVSFYDFYSLRRPAIFQDGILYIDGRSCRLCLPVQDIAKHSTLAAFSELCLLYCECRRISDKGGEILQTTIVAAMTAGNADLLMEGRNGVFVDNEGNDWDATLTKIVIKPISLRQAMWDPYKRFGRMVTEQISKFASAKEAASADAIGKKIESAGAAAAQGAAPAAPAQGFDIGKTVGIFAAIGIALGAIGTAVASILRGLFALSWWQFPLLFVAVFLLVSGPSMVLAWLKLRKRTLGPVLEASGWAVNGAVPINFSLGKALTDMAVLPPNATRSYSDPFKKPRVWPWVAALLLGIGIAVAAWWLWKHPVDLESLLPK